MSDDWHNFIWVDEKPICTKCGKPPVKSSEYGYQRIPCRPDAELVEQPEEGKEVGR
jgi:hypothetical protein